MNNSIYLSVSFEDIAEILKQKFPEILGDKRLRFVWTDASLDDVVFRFQEIPRGESG